MGRKRRWGGSGVESGEGDTVVSSAHDNFFVLVLFHLHLHLSGIILPDLPHVFLFLIQSFLSPSENKISLCFGVYSLSLSRIKSCRHSLLCSCVFLMMLFLFPGAVIIPLCPFVIIVSPVLYLSCSGTASVWEWRLNCEFVWILSLSCDLCLVPRFPRVPCV